MHCYEGKVSVRLPKNRQGVVLEANDAIRIENNRLQAVLNNSDQAPPWLNGKIKFDNQSLREVFAELERQYAIEIIYPTDIASRVYNGTVPGTDQQTSLKLVCEAMNLQYLVQGEKRIEIQEK